MCIIISIYQQEQDAEIQKELIELLYEYQRNNSDGVGIIALNDASHYKSLRIERINRREISELLQRYKNVNFHFRLASSGSKTKRNIHFWNFANWYFSHNGMVSGLGKSDLSDSNELFKKMIKSGYITKRNDIKIGKIKKLVQRLGFWGRMVFANKATEKIFYFGDYKATCIERKVLVISSISLQFSSHFNMMGFSFEKPEQFEVLENDVNGIFSVNLKNSKMKMIDEKGISGTWNYGEIDDYKSDTCTIARQPTLLTKEEKETAKKYEEDCKKAEEEYNKEIENLEKDKPLSTEEILEQQEKLQKQEEKEIQTDNMSND